MEPEGTERCFSIRTITFCACQGTATAYFAQNVSMSIYTVMSISIKQYFICARSVGPFDPPEEEKGVKHIFSLFLESCFSRVAWNLFDVGDQSVPTHLASNIHLGSFQCSLEGGQPSVHHRQVYDTTWLNFTKEGYTLLECTTQNSQGTRSYLLTISTPAHQ